MNKEIADRISQKVKSLDPGIKEDMAFSYGLFRENNSRGIVSLLLADLIKNTKDEGERELLIDINLLLSQMEIDYSKE